MQTLVCQPDGSPSLFSVEGVVGLLFLFTVALVIFGGVVAVGSRGKIRSQRLVRAVAGLAVCFSGLAGINYFLLSPFLAMMQLLIYVGAVSILIAFGIMMATPEGGMVSGLKNPSLLAGPMALSVAALLFAALTVLAVKTQWQVFPRTGSADIKAMGMALLTSHTLVFELVSIVLLMAIIGALVLARRGRS